MGRVAKAKPEEDEFGSGETEVSGEKILSKKSRGKRTERMLRNIDNFHTADVSEADGRV